MLVGINQATARQWLDEAKPGQKLQYFEGFLAVGKDANGQQLPDAERRALASVADQLWRAAQRDLVHLVQRRLGEDHFEYLAVARRQIPR